MAIKQISKIQNRSGDLADLPQLSVGELGFATDAKRLFIGNDTNIPDILPDNTEILTAFSSIPAPGANTQVLFNDDSIVGATGSIPAPGANANTRFTYDYLAGNANANGGRGLLTVNNANITDLMTASTLRVTGEAFVDGDLTVGGNITFINQQQLTVDDPVIVLGANSGTSNTSNYAAGVLMTYYNVSQKQAFMGFLPALGSPTPNTFVLFSNVTSNNATNITGDLANLQVGNANVVGTLTAGNIAAPGSNTQIIYNNGGIFAAKAGFTFDNLTDTLSVVNSTVTALVATTSVTTPTIVQGSSNIRLAVGGNVTISSAGTSDVFTITSAGANVVGVLQVSGNITTLANANVGNVNSTTGVFSANVNVTNNVTGANLAVTNNANVGNIANVGNLAVTGNVLTSLLPTPGSDGTTGLDLGGIGQRWRDLYLSGNTLYLGANGTTSGFSVEPVSGSIIATTGGGANWTLSGTTGTGLITVPSISATTSITTPALESTGNLAVTANAVIGENLSAGNISTTGSFSVTNISSSGNISAGGWANIGNGAVLGANNSTSVVIKSGNIVTDASTSNLLTATAVVVGGTTYAVGPSTVTFANAATVFTMGGISGTATIQNPTVSGTQTTQNLWNTVATTVNMVGAAENVNFAVSPAAAQTANILYSVGDQFIRMGRTTGNQNIGAFNIISGSGNQSASMLTTTGVSQALGVMLASGGTQTSNVLYSAGDQTVRLARTASTQTANVLSAGTTQAANVITSAGDQTANVMITGGTQTANVLYSASTQILNLGRTAAIQTANVLYAGTTQAANVITSLSNQTANVIISGGTQTANVLYSASTQVLDLARSATTQTANVLYSASTQVLDVGKTASDQTANVLYAGVTQAANAITSAGNQTANVIISGGTQTANVLYSASTQVLDVAKSGSTQTANVLYSGAAQVLDVAKSGSTQTANVLYSAGAQTANVLITTGVQTSNVLYSSAAQTLNLGRTASTQTANVLYSTGDQVVRIGRTGGNQVVGAFNIISGSGNQAVTMFGATGVQTINLAATSNATSTYNIFSGPTGSGNIKTVNIATGGDANTTNIGVGSNAGVVTINTPTIAGSQTTQNLWNTVATTVNFIGAATTISIGAATGTTTVNNNLTATGNICGANIDTAGNVVASVIKSNVATGTAPFFVNSTTVVPNLYANLANYIATTTVTTGTFYPTFVSSSPTGNYSVSSNTALSFDAGTGNLATTLLSASGTITGGNLSTGGNVVASGNASITGNISGGNISTAGTVTATGTVTGGNLSTGGNVVASGNASITGNISGGNISTAGTVTATGNVTGGNLITSGYVQTPSLTTGAAATAGSITGTWTLSAGSTLQATYADLAERYTSDHDYDPGTVVMIGGTAETTIANYDGRYRLAGIVSTNPAYVLNSTAANSVIIALTGRVPCLVTGNIVKGDMLTISNIDGVATSTTISAYGTVIGRALENYNDSNVGTIEVKVDRA